MLEEKLQNRSN